MQKLELTAAKVDTNWWNQEECETKGKNQTKYPIRYYKLPDLGYVFYEDPNTGAWRMRKNREWVLDDDTIYWINSILWNGKEGEDETIDPKVVEEWIKEADRKQGVLKDEQY